MKSVPLAFAFLLTLCAAAAAQVPDPGCTSRPEGAVPLFLGVTSRYSALPARRRKATLSAPHT